MSLKMKDKDVMCPTCNVPCKIIGKFECVHCGTVHEVYECPKCKAWIFIPDYVPTIKIGW